MQSYREMLLELVRRAKSERRAAAYFGISQSSFNNWMRARALPDDEQARRMAELLGHDAAYVVALIHAERAKSDEMRATWNRIAEAFGKAAMLAIVAAAPFAASTDARAGFNSSGFAPSESHIARHPRGPRRPRTLLARAAQVIGILP